MNKYKKTFYLIVLFIGLMMLFSQVVSAVTVFDEKIQKEIYSGEYYDDLLLSEKGYLAPNGESINPGSDNICTIISGENIVELFKSSECYAKGLKEGVTTVEVYNTVKDYKWYIEITVIDSNEIQPSDPEYFYKSISEFDPMNEYDYGNVKSCLVSGTYNVTFDNLIFCASHNLDIFQYHDNDSVYCEKGFEPFRINFHIDGWNYKGYGCRKLKISDVPSEEIPKDEEKWDYEHLCDNKGIKQAVKIIGYVILIIKWVAPLIIIVLGMVDYGKAVISDDEQAISKSTKALIRRLIAGIVIFFIPTLVLALLEIVKITRGIEKEENDKFGACTRCLFNPVNDCTTRDGNIEKASSGENFGTGDGSPIGGNPNSGYDIPNEVP